MDNGLSPVKVYRQNFHEHVLILIVMDNGLSQVVTLDPNKGLKSLNPYCNG